jgi:hypothetical protein
VFTNGAVELALATFLCWTASTLGGLEPLR